VTTLRIFVQQLRRDRVTLPIWILGTAALMATAAASVGQEYGDAKGRASILAVALATPALLALRGNPNGASLGSAVHFQSFAFLAVTIGLMNVFLATRHGRQDEERGRRELVLAAPVSRLSPPVATLLLGLLANGVFVLIAIGAYAPAGVSTQGAVLSSVALGMTGLAFLALTMIAGELMQTSRAANGVGVVLVLGSYALRAAGDATGSVDITKLTLQPGWPSWISPIGWGQQTLAFTDNHWWPVAALAALFVVAAAVALVIHSRRELGASIFVERSGRATARATLNSPFALAWRLQWPTIVPWAAGSALLGLALGSLVTAIAHANLDSPGLAALIQSLGHTSSTSLGTALIPVVMVFVGAVAAAAGVQAVLRLREEEAEGRLENLLAEPRSRVSWVLAFTGVGALTVIITLGATALTSGLSFLSTSTPDTGWTAAGSALVQIPAALVFVGVTALLVGLLPRAAIGLGWGVYGILLVIGLFAKLLNLPDWLAKVSPISNVPSLPNDDWWPTVIVGAVAILATVIGALAYRRRDLSA
jgi:ABC-2 type transport system permease protein